MVGMKLDDAAARLEALGNPTRLKIYRLLVRAGAEGLPVGRLQAKIDIAASTLSHHLKALVAVGLVTQTREGTTLVCHTNYELMRGLIAYLVAECCTEGSCAPVTLPNKAA
jgi:ArsR family transcriptional regulator, arsenate/arsenite/antimonite-responsive transcriptional repressor